MLEASIYVHVPFCARKCAYCDFESHAGMLQYADEYIDKVIEESALAVSERGSIFVPTVYIGGGTPSILTSKQIYRLICGVLSNFTISNNAEITMEANPGTLGMEKLRSARAAGVNRLSLGAQSANDSELKMLGRIHTWADVVKAVELSRAAGFDNISLDLMYELPNQTPDNAVFSLKQAVELNPEHLSCYSLICEEGTLLTSRIKSGELKACNEENAIEMQTEILGILKENGYKHYEISNYAKNGRESEHNKAYWTRKNYMGFGCAAHSLVNDIRYANPNFERYMKGERSIDKDVLSLSDILEETIMLNTRTSRGIDITEFKYRFGEKNAHALVESAHGFVKNGLMRIEDSRLSVTEKGFNIHNAIVLSIITHVQTA